jgi:hypothetical protein
MDLPKERHPPRHENVNVFNGLMPIGFGLLVTGYSQAVRTASFKGEKCPV